MIDKTRNFQEDHQVELGKEISYPQNYDVGLLEPIARSKSREALWAGNMLDFNGVDLWTAYELSWLNDNGVPQIAIAEFEFPAQSANIVESKSFKYYLNSFNQMRYASSEVLVDILKKDLSACIQDDVKVCIFAPDSFAGIEVASGMCVDTLDVVAATYEPSPALLKCSTQDVDHIQLYSHLLKSNCPVTGQPDWATVWIEYSGKEIIPSSFLQYVISYRGHQDFHESCVEAFFKDIMTQCNPTFLSVFARYTRRGGLDINPFRSSGEITLPFGRLSRQ